jgi:hypothetical protein
MIKKSGQNSCSAVDHSILRQPPGHGTTSNRLNFIDNGNNNIRSLPPAPEINFAPQQNFMLQQNHINRY